MLIFPQPDALFSLSESCNQLTPTEKKNMNLGIPVE